MVTTPKGAVGSVVPASADQISRQAATMRGCMHPYPALLNDERASPRDTAAETRALMARNAARREVAAAFASVRVWLFPTPVYDDLHSSSIPGGTSSPLIHFDDVSEEFWEALARLRRALAGELAQPRAFGGAPLTGDKLSFAVPAVVRLLNAGQLVRPGAVVQTMLQAKVGRVAWWSAG